MDTGCTIQGSMVTDNEPRASRVVLFWISFYGDFQVKMLQILYWRVQSFSLTLLAVGVGDLPQRTSFISRLAKTPKKYSCHPRRYYLSGKFLKASSLEPMKRLKGKIVGSRRSSNRLYRPLRKEVCEIRLLSILPSDKPDAVLCCNLESVPIDRAPRYKALSYAWGDASVTEEIYVNGHGFRATFNLHAALHNFRSTCPGVHIWVDAICVNQDDLLERGHQVQLMQKIYSKADETLVWLGAEAEESERAIEFIELLSDVAEDCRSRTPADTPYDFGVWGSPVHWGIDDDFTALMSLFSRQWWYRVWIVQEVAVSRSISLHCGYRKFTWLAVRQACWVCLFLKDSILALFSGLTDGPQRCRQMVKGMGRVSTINSLRDTFGPNIGLEITGFQRSVLNLLASHRPAASTDPRDKFVALVGLTTDTTLLNTVHVYSDSIANTFTTAAKLIAETQVVAPLNFLDHSGSPRSRSDLPSWVPDWSCTGSRPYKMLYWQDHPYAGARNSIKYNASLNSIPSPIRRFTFNDDCRSLLAHGILFDTLVISGPSIDYLKLVEGSSSLGLKGDQCEKCILGPDNIFRALLGEGDSEVFCRTLVMNRTSSTGTTLPVEWLALWSRMVSQFKNIRFFGGHCYHNLTCLRSPIELLGAINDTPLLHLSQSEELQLPSFTRAVRDIGAGRRISITGKNYLCHAPADIENGDIIVVLFNCDAPVILRRQRESYRFIGTCYVHGIMQGEAIDGIQNGTYAPQTFDIR